MSGSVPSPVRRGKERMGAKLRCSGLLKRLSAPTPTLPRKRGRELVRLKEVPFCLEPVHDLDQGMQCKAKRHEKYSRTTCTLRFFVASSCQLNGPQCALQRDREQALTLRPTPLALHPLPVAAWHVVAPLEYYCRARCWKSRIADSAPIVRARHIAPLHRCGA